MFNRPPPESDRTLLEQMARDISVIRLIVQSAFVLTILGVIAVWYSSA